jgi:aquaporin Z
MELIMKRYGAEFLGTFWLVMGGCGSAVLAATFPEVGIGLHGVALAFGLSVLTMAYAIGPISGCHLNPAVSVGLWAGGRFPASQLLPYIVAQVAGGIIAGGVLYLIASGAPGFDASAGFAANGYGVHSPGGYTMVAGLVSEVVMTMFFVLIILGATDQRAPAGFAPIAIGFALTLIHLISIPVTNTSVNPARSTAVAVPCSAQQSTVLSAPGTLLLPRQKPACMAMWNGASGKCAVVAGARISILAFINTQLERYHSILIPAFHQTDQTDRNATFWWRFYLRNSYSNSSCNKYSELILCMLSNIHIRHFHLSCIS